MLQASLPSRVDCERLLHDAGFLRRQAARAVPAVLKAFDPQVAEQMAAIERARRALR